MNSARIALFPHLDRVPWEAEYSGFLNGNPPLDHLHCSSLAGVGS